MTFAGRNTSPQAEYDALFSLYADIIGVALDQQNDSEQNDQDSSHSQEPGKQKSHWWCCG